MGQLKRILVTPTLQVRTHWRSCDAYRVLIFGVGVTEIHLLIVNRHDRTSTGYGSSWKMARMSMSAVATSTSTLTAYTVLLYITILFVLLYHCIIILLVLY